MTRHLRGILKPVAGLVAGLLAAAGLTLVSPTAPAEAATFSVPQFVRTISGNGRPGVYPWGAQYNPVSNEVVVGDYLNNQIRRYSPEGRILGSFYRPDATGQPYSLAVHPTTGDIYVPEIADGRTSDKVAIYSKTGTFLRQMTISSSDYIAWVTLDAAGNLVVADSHYYDTLSSPPVVNVYRTSDSRRQRTFSILPPGTTSSTVPRVYGIDVDPTTGSYWMTDTWNNRILKYSSTGTFQASYSMDGIVTSDARGMELDVARNRLYVSDSGAGQLEVFDLSGAHLASLGQAGPGATQLRSPRQPAVDPATGDVYVAEYGNGRVHRYTATGQDAGIFPEPAQPAVPGQLGEPRDVDVDDETGEVWVADSWNQRFQKFHPDGEFLGTWGNRSSSPTYGMNYPRGIAVDPARDTVWVANQRGHHIKRYDRRGGFRDQLGDALLDDEGVGHFRWPLDMELDAPRDRVIVSDRNSSKVKILDATTGAETGSFTRSPNHAIAVDPATGNLYVADDVNSRIHLYNPTGTTLISSFGAKGTAAGQFRHIWDMTITGGRLYVTDDLSSQVSVFDLAGVYQGRWGGYGAGAYQFKNPSGIAADPAGRLYIADAGNDRVVVVDTTKARGGGNWPAPVLRVGSPGDNAALSGQPVRLSGRVTDETGVGTVQIAVRNTVTGQWFDATKSTWQATQTWALAPYWGPDVKDVEFAWTFIGVDYGGSYQAVFRAVDAAGNASATSTRSFTILEKSTTDTLAPTSYVSSPLEGEVLDAAPLLTLAGHAADDVALERTEVNLRRVGTNQWLQPDGTWGGFTWLPATLDDPGTISSAWTLGWSQPTNGDYVLQVRSVDVIGNVEPAVVQRSFSVGDPDTDPPDATVAEPVAGTTYPEGPLTLRGSASDNRGVAGVRLTIRNVTTGQWWQADGTWGASAVPFEAELSAPGSPSTQWSLGWTPPGPADYAIGVNTVDTSGNIDPTKPWVPFTVVAGGLDTEAPQLTVTSPAGQSVPVADAAITGTATDNVAVAKVEVAVKDRATNRWLRPDGTWGSTFGWVPATVDPPGGATTTWRLQWPAATGGYGYQVRVTDGAGNVASKPFTQFNVS